MVWRRVLQLLSLWHGSISHSSVYELGHCRRSLLLAEDDSKDGRESHRFRRAMQKVHCPSRRSRRSGLGRVVKGKFWFELCVHIVYVQVVHITRRVRRAANYVVLLSARLILCAMGTPFSICPHKMESVRIIILFNFSGRVLNHNRLKTSE